MDLTLFLAQLLGIYMVVAGLSGLLYPVRAKRAMNEVTRSYVIPYFDGALALIFGLLIVLTHNVWNGTVETIVTLVGWLAVVEGLAMLLLPQESITSLLKRFQSQSAITIWSGVALLVGGYLVYVSFLA
jgi:uncharacterized protein YjeT (DUF2065 family)